MRYPVSGLPRSGGKRARRRLVGMIALASVALASLLLVGAPEGAGDTGFQLLPANARPTVPIPAVDPAFGLRVPAGTTDQKVRDAYGQLPLAFVANAGQTDARVRFAAQAARAAFHFTREEAV